MKYGESTFDILYLLFAITTGIIILVKKRDTVGKMMGAAALTLGIGDAFHLVPRVLNYFVDKDLALALGLGKLVTSITMTVFYILLFFLHTKLFVWENENEKKSVMISLLMLMLCRIMICLNPLNGWFTGESSILWSVLRNTPFVAIGVLIVLIYYRTRNDNKTFKRLWLYVTLSFLFYIPVAVFASLVPMLGMLMLPKTVCYVLILGIFLKCARENR